METAQQIKMSQGALLIKYALLDILLIVN